MKGILELARHYFIPHPGNNHKPHLFRDHTVFFLMAFIIGTEFVVISASLLFHQTSFFLSAVLPNALVELTNQERVKSAVPVLKMNPLLAKAAEAKAKDMASKGYFAHTSPDGTTPWYWIINSGYVFDRAGENLAVNFYGSEDVVNAWMNSPSHKQNILSAGFTEVGIGIAEGMYQGRSVVFVAQMFGKPATIAPLALEEARAVAVAPTVSAKSPSSSLPPSPVPAIVRAVPRVSTASPATPAPGVLSESIDTETPGTQGAPESPSAPAPVPHYLGLADRIFLHPDIFLAYAYILAALFVAIPLTLSLAIELRRGHLRHVMLGSTLFATLFMLAWLNQSGVFSATILV